SRNPSRLWPRLLHPADPLPRTRPAFHPRWRNRDARRGRADLRQLLAHQLRARRDELVASPRDDRLVAAAAPARLHLLPPRVELAQTLALVRHPAAGDTRPDGLGESIHGTA